MCGPFWKSSQPPRSQQDNETNVSRRNVVKAAVGLGAVIAAGSGVAHKAAPEQHKAHAQEVDGTRARSWSESDNIDTSIKLEGEGWVTLQTEFPFWALGFGWDFASGTWPAVQFGVSHDGQTWDDGYFMAARSDGGPVATDDRHHTDLFFADGHEFVRYRTMDGEGNLVILERFQVTYIDPTDGPWEPDRGATMMRTTAVNDDTLVPPTIITRAQWGANESLRFSGASEIWPSEYQDVEHAIVHHAAVNYGSDGYNAVRSIYYYHCVTQGWGDIGYNYVVDVNGNIFEGRVGGANVIGGHAFEYANGSSGICVMGDFTSVDPPWVSKVALANIVAYVTRDLSPHGSKPFHSVPALPTIAAHRDVNQSSCPGNALYDDLPWLRNQVKSILDQGLLDSQNPGGIVPGDWVRIQTENNTPLPMRSQPGMGQLVIGNIPYNSLVEVERGPLGDNTYNWYLVHYNNRQGWVPADYLLVDPPIEEPTDGYTYGQNVRLTTTTSLRRTPNGASSGTVSSGSWAFIMAGSTPAGGTNWFQLRTQSNGDGWVPRSAITLAPVYNPSPRFPVGSHVITTVAAPIRVRPGISQTAGGTVPAGRTLQVSVAPIAVTDRIWYGVYGGTGTGGGWIEEGHLRAGPGSITVIGNVTAPGQQFRVTEAVNMRTAPGTGNSVIATLAVGVMGTVTAGPQTASGYSWWQVRTDSNQQGWVVSTYIQQIRTGNPGNLTGFGVGVTVRTNTAVNMRSDAGTGYSIVAELPSNTNGTIIDGPRVSTGFTWWRIRTVSGQVGWVAQSYLVRTSGLPPKFRSGDSVRTTQKVTTLTNVNDWNSRGVIAGNEYGAILAGPTAARGRQWYRIRFASGIFWVPQEFLASGNRFVAGASVRTTQKVMTLANINNTSATGTMAANQFGAVLSTPRWVNSRLWYQIRFASSVVWVPQEFLVSGNKFDVGTSVRTTQNVMTLANINNPSASGSIAGNQHGAILSTPRWVNSRLWCRIRFASSIVWVPQDFLDTGNRFDVGDSVHTTQSVMTLANINNPSASGTMASNQFGAILSTPRWVNSRLWYRIRFASEIMWVPQDFLDLGNRFDVGDSVHTTRTVMTLANVSNPSSNGSIAGDQYGAILSAPQWVNSRLWYRIRFASDVVWVPQDFLTPGNMFTAGQLVRTTQNVVNTSSPGDLTDSTTLTEGTVLEVLDGPVYSTGRLWYYVANVEDGGWTPQAFLTPN